MPITLCRRASRFVAALFALAFVWTLLVSPARADLPAWTTVWRDDFNGPAGTGLDRTQWQYDLGHSYPGGAWNWGTGEVEAMTDSTSNVALDGSGNLAITALRDSSGNWTSGRVESARTDFAAPAGGVLRVESRLKLPDVSGDAAAGYWPAFWMLGDSARAVAATNWPGVGEIDLMEDVNGLADTWATLHCGVIDGGPCNEKTGLSSGPVSCADCATAFHTYAMELDFSTSPEQLRFYRDGNLVRSVTSAQMDATTWANALHHGFFVIYDLALGGEFPAALGQ
ncbi:MAG TPA: glycoside hydrolase family 16 protein, partial [Propionibacteriaceae bacterium]|nr:glycoside hydrolase family 16 protein [Propionibacteriaceae bacterium]